MVWCCVQVYTFNFSPLFLSSGVSVCGVGERTERPLSGLPGCQQPDSDWTPDDRHGGDGGGVSFRRAVTEAVIRYIDD